MIFDFETENDEHPRLGSTRTQYNNFDGRCAFCVQLGQSLFSKDHDWGPPSRPSPSTKNVNSNDTTTDKTKQQNKTTKKNNYLNVFEIEAIIA